METPMVFPSAHAAADRDTVNKAAPINFFNI
jgi:hypothetical protein